jgi:hypothetical protein
VKEYLKNNLNQEFLDNFVGFRKELMKEALLEVAKKNKYI